MAAASWSAAPARIGGLERTVERVAIACIALAGLYAVPAAILRASALGLAHRGRRGSSVLLRISERVTSAHLRRVVDAVFAGLIAGSALSESVPAAALAGGGADASVASASIDAGEGRGPASEFGAENYSGLSVDPGLDSGLDAGSTDATGAEDSGLDDGNVIELEPGPGDSFAEIPPPPEDRAVSAWLAGDTPASSALMPAPPDSWAYAGGPTAQPDADPGYEAFDRETGLEDDSIVVSTATGYPGLDYTGQLGQDAAAREDGEPYAYAGDEQELPEYEPYGLSEAGPYRTDEGAAFAATAGSAGAGPAAGGAAGTTDPTQADGRRAEHYVIESGDCLWNIAKGRLPAGASDASIDTYWREIYDANRARLGSNPSLIYPGTEIEIPPAGSGAAESATAAAGAR